jgi:hypothetical protein
MQPKWRGRAVAVASLESRVYNLRYRVQGSGFRVYNLGFGVQG